MPLVKGKLIKPSEAATAGHCPECGESMEGVHIPAHIDSHWPRLDSNDPAHRTAISRRRMLLQMHDDAQKAAANKPTPKAETQPEEDQA